MSSPLKYFDFKTPISTICKIVAKNGTYQKTSTGFLTKQHCILTTAHGLVMDNHVLADSVTIYFGNQIPLRDNTWAIEIDKTYFKLKNNSNLSRIKNKDDLAIIQIPILHQSLLAKYIDLLQAFRIRDAIIATDDYVFTGYCKKDNKNTNDNNQSSEDIQIYSDKIKLKKRSRMILNVDQGACDGMSGSPVFTVTKSREFHVVGMIFSSVVNESQMLNFTNNKEISNWLIANI